ncbi:MAG: 1,4-dihydroxy-6-naphthoate synthase [Saprospiraceae bacterium]|nr:1,4-dihydroxy-6-naphthoate synthase [Saprospiraceae bacterium]
MKDHKGKINLAISPCPNDTFIFGGWINNLIESDISIETVHYCDIQELNELATKGNFDVIKVSAAMALNVLDKYEILQSGSAMGLDCGPLLISKRKIQINEICKYKVGIPGKNTTANFLFKFAFPDCKNIIHLNFTEIENALLNEEIDLGVIIHENRFTYSSKNLLLVLDLGKHWYQLTKLPIPLGVILVRKDLNNDMKSAINLSIRDSINYANLNRNSLMPYIKEHASELEESVINQHIKLYVNEFSLDLGSNGNSALNFLFNIIKA